MIGAGTLNRRVEFEQAIETVDPEYNSPVRSWVGIGARWASRQDVSDYETIAAGELGSALGARFVVRRDELTVTIRPSDRLRHDGVVWNIQAVREKADHGLAYLELRAVREFE